MSVDRAVVANQPGGASLRNFNDEIVVKMQLEDDDEGWWILMARVTLISSDSDRQNATAKLVHDANVVIIEETNYMDYLDPICVYLQVGFQVKGKETVTLECNTFKGVGNLGSVVALKVDEIDFQ